MFETEAQLCECFRQDALAAGWVVYPENDGWDQLLVRRQLQVGIQAKLQAIPEVLLQALPADPRRDSHGPHYRAVLVGGFLGRTPRARRAHRASFYQLARSVRVLVLEPTTPGINRWLRTGHGAENLTLRRRYWYNSPVDFRYYRWYPRATIWVPPFVPDIPAGVPSPQSVSPWQIAAVRLERLGVKKGWVCLEDARTCTSDAGGRWNPHTLLQRFYVSTTTPAVGRQMRWVPGPPHWAASSRYPAVAAAINE